MNITLKCKDSQCVNHNSLDQNGFQKFGSYKAKHNGQPIPRYKCKACGRTVSATKMLGSSNLKKPEVTEEIFRLYCSRMTIRRIAKVLKLSPTTVVDRIKFLGVQCYKYHERLIADGLLRTDVINYDEMENFEHTRLKPFQ